MLRLKAVILLFLACGASPQVREMETPQTREEEVRDLIQKFNLAYEQKDSESMSSLVTSDLTAIAGGRVFSSWNDYNENFLRTVFSRSMPTSTWQIEKLVTSPEMAWAYTKTTYTVRRQAQQIQADLFQLFVLRKTPTKTAQTAKSKTGGALSASWRITVIDNSFHREAPNAQGQTDNSQSGEQPKE